MDRRTALKRLGVGGVTVAGASVVLSQPAFAYTNPMVTGSPTVTVTTAGSLTATIGISSVPLATCPGSALSTPVPVQVSLTWETYWPDGGVVMSTGFGADVSISSTYAEWYPNDRILVTLVYRYQCVYEGSTTELCVQWFREFSSSTFGSPTIWTQIAASGPTVVACPGALASSSLRSSVQHAAGGRPRGSTPTP